MALLYDISPPVSPDLPVWPGDTPPSREVLLDMRKGDHLTLCTLHSTVHAGAHADAPSHYGADAPAIHERPLELYLGKCQVMKLPPSRGQRLGRGALPVDVTAPRLLLATGSFPDPHCFNQDFSSYSVELVDMLHGLGVRLIGIDTPSVDLFNSKNLPVHKTCLAHDMAILEGLVLDHVPAGEYELIALPLHLVGFDASPVRAVLRALA
ncbi:MAG: cyclase family protein [Acidobacteriota bacterium]